MTEENPVTSVHCRHFVEPDGSLVCICMRCLRTLVRGRNESDLHLQVPEHVCPGDWQATKHATETPSDASAARSCARR